MPDPKHEPRLPNTNINSVLDEIIAEKGGSAQVASVGSPLGFIQRYTDALRMRDPVAIGLTGLAVFALVLLIIVASTGGGSERSGTGQTPADTTLSEGTSASNSAVGTIQVDTSSPATSTSSETTPSTSSQTSNSTPTESINPALSSSRRPTTNNRISVPTPVVTTPIVTTPTPEPTPAPTPTPIVNPAPLVPQLPPLKLGTLCNIKDSGLNEASGLAASVKHPGVVYTHNDEVGPIYAVNTANCKVVAKITVSGLRSDPDPEAITVDRTTGKIWFGDIGNGHPGQPNSMTDKKKELKYPNLPARIVVFDEPSKLSGNIKITNVKTHNITYQGGMQNSESLLVNPKTGQGYLINKQATSTVYRLPSPLKSGAAKAGVKIPGWVTDATFTNDGKWVFIRYRTATNAAPTNVLVYNAQTWKRDGAVTVPKVKQGESIAMETNGRSFIIGSEGSNSPLVRVKIPAKYGGDPAVAPIDLCRNIAGTQTAVPAGYTRDSAGNCKRSSTPVRTPSKIDLKNWKLTLPIGSSGKPLEIKNRNLATYVNAPWYTKLGDGSRQFYVDSNKATATTENSSNPRSELREMNGSNLASWSSTSGTHTMLIRQKVTQNTGRGHVVIGQIHDSEDDVTVFRLERGQLWVTNGDKTHGYLIDGKVKIGQIITVGFRVTSGHIWYYYSPTGSKNPPIVKNYAQAKKFSGAYFKAGNYCQCSKKNYSGQSITKVVIMGLGVTHNGKLPDIGGN